MENEEDFDISAYGVDAEFYVPAGAEPDENGKYDDYIVSFGDWLAVQEGGYQFNCVYGELPNSELYNDDEQEEYIASEKRRLWAEYVVPYIIKGKQISIKQIDFEETRPNEASDPDEPYGRTMDALRSVVMMSQAGEESDAEDGLFLYTFDLDECFDKDGFAVDGGDLDCYKGTAAEVSIPKGVKTIGGYAFNGCTSLVKLSISKAVTEIRGGAFEGCTALREIRYGGTQAEWFMLNAFSGLSENVTVHCSDGDFVPPAKTATEYAIPDSVTEIGSYAFSGCTSLAKVTIPASVTEISSTAFEGCAALKEVRYGGTQMQWFMLKGSRRVPAGTVVHCSDGDTQAEANAADEVVIPEGVTKLDSEMFGDDKSFSKVAIPASVTEIGESAFSGCKSLASVTIPASVTEIGKWAFSGCKSLASVTIPASVTKIGNYAFENCTSLASVTIPAGVTEIGKEAFNACTALKEVHYTGTKAQWEAVEKGDDWCRHIPAQELRCSDGTMELPACRIVDGVLERWYRDGSEAVIPEGVTQIDSYAFSRCTSLTSVSIPDSVTEIGVSAFSGCTALASVSIPEGVTEISGAFEGCTSLASVSIPASVTTIGEDAFKACTALKEVRYGGTKAQWFTRKLFWRFYGDVAVQCSDGEGISKDMTEVVIPEGVTKIGDRAFYGYTALASVTIPEGVTVIGDYAFSGCTALASVSIPASVTVIDVSPFDGCTAIKEVRYSGTQAQWFMLQLFRQLPDDAVVHCSDGDAFSGCTALTSVSIPDGVTEIDEHAFDDCTSLASVSIPASVTEIGRSAFEGCTALKEVLYGGTKTQWFMLEVFRQLPAGAVVHCSDGDGFSRSMTEVVIPEGVTEIGKSAFKGCTALASVSIPASVTKIDGDYYGGGAFEGCTSLASITIPGSVTKIGEKAFKGCTALASVTIPEGVTEIGGSAFDGCTSLASVSIPASVTEIGRSAFEDCTSLASVSIPEGVTEIGGEAFKDCTALASVSIPASVTKIYGNTFSGCTAVKEVRYGGTKAQWFTEKFFHYFPEDVTVHCSDGDGFSRSMTEVVIPDCVTEIGQYAFKGCTSLASVSIPGSVTKIWYNTFEGCTSVKEIRYGGTQAQWFMLEVFRQLPAGTVVHCSDGDAENPKGATEYIIPDGVTEIGGSAFYGCTSLASVSIPASVTEIGDDAFEDCTSLASVSIPEGVTEIGRYAFKGCTALASVSIPASVTEIGDRAFYSCSSLASVSIPEGVTKIGERAFDDCTSLAEISYAGSRAQWFMLNGFKSVPGNVTVRCSDGGAQPISEDFAEISIPEGVTKIGDEAFSYFYSLTSVVIPASVMEIGDRAFYSCSSLTSVTIPEGVAKIGQYAFDGCESLERLVIMPGVTAIGNDVFAGLKSLSSVYIPASVTAIGKNAFKGCKSLKEIKFGGTEDEWFSIKKAKGWDKGISVTEVQFSCVPPDVAELVIPDGTTEIRPGAYKGYGTLRSVTIPASVTEIGEGAFEDCTSLASVTIPASVTEIGYGAFRGCTSLASVTIPASVTEIGEEAFKGCTALAEIHYAGTKDQWAAVTKGEDWNKDVPAKEVLVRKQ